MRAIVAVLVLAACDVGEDGPFPSERIGSDVPPCRPERCNGVDDDCDGLVDEPDRALEGEGVVLLWADADGDSYGAGEPIRACSLLPGFATIDGDCAPHDPAISPGAVERCNAIDDDCDGLVDTEDDPNPGVLSWPDRDGDGWGDDAAAPELRCPGAPGWATRPGDCDDERFTKHPGVDETCNFIDDDCDGLVDDDDPDLVSIFYRDGDDDGFASPDLRRSCTDRLTSPFPVDCDDEDPLTFPGSPHDVACDGVARDCVREVFVPSEVPDLATAAAGPGARRICLEPGAHAVSGVVALAPGTSIHGIGGSDAVALVPPTLADDFHLHGAGGLTVEGVRLGPVACDRPDGCDGVVTVVGGPAVLRDVRLDTVVCLAEACAPALDVRHADLVVVDGLRAEDVVFGGEHVCGGVLRAQVAARGGTVSLRDVVLHDVHGACAGGDLVVMDLDAPVVDVDGLTVRRLRLFETAPGDATLLRTDGDRVTLRHLDVRDVEALSLHGPHEGVLLRGEAPPAGRLVVAGAIFAGVRLEGDARIAPIAAAGFTGLWNTTFAGLRLTTPVASPLLLTRGAADLDRVLAAWVTGASGPLVDGPVTVGEVGLWEVSGPLATDEPPARVADPRFVRIDLGDAADGWDLHPHPDSPVGHLGAYAGGDW